MAKRAKRLLYNPDVKGRFVLRWHNGFLLGYNPFTFCRKYLWLWRDRHSAFFSLNKIKGRL